MFSRLQTGWLPYGLKKEGLRDVLRYVKTRHCQALPRMLYDLSAIDERTERIARASLTRISRLLSLAVPGQE